MKAGEAQKAEKETAEEFYTRVGLAYAAPTRLWEDDVEKENRRYRQWASYYARGEPQGPEARGCSIASAWPTRRAHTSRPRHA